MRLASARRTVFQELVEVPAHSWVIARANKKLTKNWQSYRHPIWKTAFRSYDVRVVISGEIASQASFGSSMSFSLWRRREREEALSKKER
jgi:hypothetical protein